MDYHLMTGGRGVSELQHPELNTKSIEMILQRVDVNIAAEGEGDFVL